MFIGALFWLNLADLDIVHPFIYPFIPVHIILSIEFHTTQLHFEVFVKSGRVARKQVKIKRVSLYSILKSNEC